MAKKYTADIIEATSITGSLLGTATNAVSSSYAVTASMTTAVTGSANYLPKFTGANTLGNSILKQETSGYLNLSSNVADASFQVTNDNAGGSGIRSIVPDTGIYGESTGAGTGVAAVSNTGYGLQIDTYSGTALVVGSYSGLLASFNGATGEKLRITNDGKVGIGTTAPSSILHVNAGASADTNIRVQSGAAGNHAKLTFSNSSNTVFWTAGYRSSTGDFGINYGDSFSSTGLTINTSGNVGIGTTSPQTALDVAGVISITAGAPYIRWVNNSNTRVGYIQHNATDLVMNADTGSVTLNAGNSEVLRASSTGLVGIGTSTSGGSRLNILNIASNPFLALRSTNNVYEIAKMNFDQDSDIWSFTNNQGATTSGISFGTVGSERMRINYIGNVGIGTTSPINGGSAAKWITLEGTTNYGGGLVSSLSGNAKAYFYSQDGYAIVQGSSGQGVKLMPNGVDGVTVLSGGNVGIGTTSPGQPLDVAGNIKGTGLLINNTAGNQQLSFQKNGSMRYAIGTEVGAGSTNDWSIYNYIAGSTSFLIYGNNNYQFYGSNVSDRRAKQNIQDLEFNATEKVLDLKPKSYFMKNDPDNIRYGFIAQDVHEILPDLVSGDLEGEGFVGLDYNGIIPILVKAIQELKAEIEILKQK